MKIRKLTEQAFGKLYAEKINNRYYINHPDWSTSAFIGDTFDEAMRVVLIVRIINPTRINWYGAFRKVTEIIRTTDYDYLIE